MELESVFYTMAIIYMAIMFIVMIAAVIAIFAIKKKVDTIHKSIEEKLHAITSIVHIGEALIDKAKDTIKSRG
jgi:cell division protein FtsL